MDSLTQITLGAAVGEVLLGKKLGNKAMLWGAIGGTIPDLDIVGNAFLSEMEALAFHRGISHSLFFAVFSPILFSWLWNIWNRRSWRRNTIYLWIKTSLWSFLLLGIVLIIYALLSFFDSPAAWLIWPLGLAAGYFVMSAYIRREIRRHPIPVITNFGDGYLLFFWAIITHILLDIFTAYGTQVFQPFHDCRAAVSSISVVDPIYTFPFLGLLIWASFFQKEHRSRRVLSWLGIAISTLYLLFTVWNQRQVSQLFDKSLEADGYTAERTHVSPTIMNNLLWNCLAEGDSTYWLGDYSVLDNVKWVKKKGLIPKNHHLLATHSQERELAILKWFSNDFYAVFSDSTTGSGWIVDLRYGTFTQNKPTAKDFVFLFRYHIDEQGNIRLSQNRGSRGDIQEALGNLWNRIKGI